MKKKYSFCSPFFILVLLCPFLLSECGHTETKDDTSAGFTRLGYTEEQKADQLLQENRKKEAFRYCLRANQYYEMAHDSARLVYSLLQTAEIQRQYNDYTELQATSVEALKYVNKSGKENLKTIYNYLGISYSQLEDYPRALAYYTKCRGLSQNEEDIFSLENNIAYVYISSGQFCKAYSILEKAAESPALRKYPKIRAVLLSNLGYSGYYCNRTDADGALRLAVAENLNQKEYYAAIASYLQLARILNTSDKEQSLLYAKQADALALKVGAADDRLLALGFLIANNAVGTPHYAKTYVKLSDSLYRAKRNAISALAEIKYSYNTERDKRLKSEAERARADAKALRQEQSKWALAILIVLLGTAVVFWIRRINIRAKEARLKAVYDSEIRFAEKLHDELANDMHQMMVYSEKSDLGDSQNKERLVQGINDMYERTRDMSRDQGRIADGDFEETLRQLIYTFSRKGCRLIATGLETTPWDRLNEIQRSVVYRSIQELLVNMNKHSECTHASLRFSFKQKTMGIQYTDNGKGLTLKPSSKNGLRIMENRIQALSGSFTFGPGQEKGFQASIKFPV